MYPEGSVHLVGAVMANFKTKLLLSFQWQSRSNVNENDSFRNDLTNKSATVW